jgi:hypothetical protein
MPAQRPSANTGCEQVQQKSSLLDHLVGEREQFGGKFNAEHLSGL